MAVTIRDLWCWYNTKLLDIMQVCRTAESLDSRSFFWLHTTALLLFTALIMCWQPQHISTHLLGTFPVDRNRCGKVLFYKAHISNVSFYFSVRYIVTHARLTGYRLANQNCACSAVLHEILRGLMNVMFFRAASTHTECGYSFPQQLIVWFWLSKGFLISSKHTVL